MSLSLFHSIAAAAVTRRILICLLTALLMPTPPAASAVGESRDFDLLIKGGAAGLTGTFPDANITFLMSAAPREVYLVVDGRLQSEPLGTAWVGAVNDPDSGPIFGPMGVMVFFDFSDALGFQAHAAAMDTSSGRVSTFSATAPYDRVTGEWRLGDASTLKAASDNDALLHVTVHLHAGPPPASGVLDVVMTEARILWQREEIPVSGETIQLRVLRNSAVTLGDPDTGELSGTAGAASSYQLCGRDSSLPCLALHAVRVGAAQVVGVRETGGGHTASCGLGGEGSLPGLSARCAEYSGTFTTDVYDGVTEDDQVLRLFYTLNADDSD